MNSPEFQRYLDELAAIFDKKWTKKELCRRIAMAIATQDSCGRCEADTMKAKLQTGEEGLLICARCCEEILAID